MQKVLGDYKNRKKLLNYSKQNPLYSFYKRNVICWLIIAINFEQIDIIVFSVRHIYITTKITIKNSANCGSMKISLYVCVYKHLKISHSESKEFSSYLPVKFVNFLKK